METQNRVEGKPLLLGRSFPSAPRGIDRGASRAGRKAPPLNLPTGGDVFAFDRDAHLMTIAPTGAGKGRSVIIPNLLSYPGPVVVIDPTGEYYGATARARMAMGHRVLRLDPFHVIDQETDALNPLDLISLGGSDVETDCQVVADLLWPRASFNDPWENAAFGLLSGVVGYIASVPEKRTVTGLVTTFVGDDVVYNLAVVLDTIGKRIPAMSYRDIASFLQQADGDRSRILSLITARNKPLMSKEVLQALDRSSVPLAEVVEGKPLTVYLAVPPAKLRSHSALLRLWLGTVLHCVTSRRALPPLATLLLLDECAQLDHLPALETAITLCRGYGLQVWTFWQDVSQLRTLYPATWPTMVNNCGSVQVFGVKDYSASSEAAALLGIEADDVRLLEADEQIIYLDGAAHKIKKIDYAADPLFAGRFEAGRPVTDR